MIIKLENQNISVEATTLGAELQSIKKNNIEYLWQGDEKYWKNRATIIFPNVGRLKDDTYFYCGKEYHLGQHGLARHSEFIVAEQSETHVVFKLTSSSETLEKYPFQFSFFVEYKLEGNTIKNKFTVINHGTNDMPFSIGGHPGFNCPLYPDETIEDYSLEFEKSETQFTYLTEGTYFTKNREQIMSNETFIPLKSELFDRGALVFENLNSKYITLKSKKSDSSVKVSVENWKYVGVWQKEKEVSRFLCIEPWTGHADFIDSTGDFFKKENVTVLKQGEQFKNEFSIEIN